MNLRAVSTAVVAGIGYCAIVFAAGFALGVLRILELAPRLGETTAVLVELPPMLLISWIACRWIVAKSHLSSRVGDRLIMGGTAFTVLMAAEVSFSFLTLGRTFQGHFVHYASLSAQLGLAGQIAFALFPVLQRR